MISGLVIHLHEDEVLAEAAIGAIAGHDLFEPGARFGRRLPAVLDARGADESRQATDWLSSLPGVVHVDVAFVHLQEQQQCGSEV